MHCASPWGTALAPEAGYGLDGPRIRRVSAWYSGSGFKVRAGNACYLDLDDALWTRGRAGNLLREFTTIGVRDEHDSDEP